MKAIKTFLLHLVMALGLILVMTACKQNTNVPAETPPASTPVASAPTVFKPPVVAEKPLQWTYTDPSNGFIMNILNNKQGDKLFFSCGTPATTYFETNTKYWSNTFVIPSGSNEKKLIDRFTINDAPLINKTLLTLPHVSDTNPIQALSTMQEVNAHFQLIKDYSSMLSGTGDLRAMYQAEGLQYEYLFSLSGLNQIACM